MPLYMRCWLCLLVGCFVILRIPVYADNITEEPQTEQGTEVEQPTELTVDDDVPIEEAVKPVEDIPLDDIVSPQIEGDEQSMSEEKTVDSEAESLVDETVPQTDNLTDLQKLVVYKEFELFALLPFLLAVVVFIWGCKWFTRTFCFLH